MNLSDRTVRRGVTWAASGTLALGMMAGSASSPATASGTGANANAGAGGRGSPRMGERLAGQPDGGRPLARELPRGHRAEGPDGSQHRLPQCRRTPAAGAASRTRSGPSRSAWARPPSASRNGARGPFPEPCGPLHFSGRRSILIPAGGEALSDPLRLDVRALQRLAVSVYLPRGHGPGDAAQQLARDQLPGIRKTDTSSAAAGPFTTKIGCWMFASGVDVLPARDVRGTVVALGNSITDGDPVLDRRRPALPRPPRTAPPGRSRADLVGVERRHRRERAPAQPRPGTLRRLGTRAAAPRRPHPGRRARGDPPRGHQRHRRGIGDGPAS